MSRSSTEPGSGDERRVRIGRVGRPHGTRGQFHVVEPTTRPGLLDPGRDIEVGGRTMRIAERAGSDAEPLISLAGVSGRSAAEELRGKPITVRRSDLGPLAADEHLVDDLIGMAVFDGERRVGTVANVLLLPSADVLEVAVEGRDGLLVPLIADAVRSIDSERIDIRLDFLGEA